MVPLPVVERVRVIDVNVIARVVPETLLLTVTSPASGGVEKPRPAFATLPITEMLGSIMQYSFPLHAPQFPDEGPRSTAVMLKLHCHPGTGETVETQDAPTIDPAVPPLNSAAPDDQT
jgi:hypothetical protein